MPDWPGWGGTAVPRLVLLWIFLWPLAGKEEEKTPCGVPGVPPKLVYRSFISVLFLRYLSFISALSQLYRRFIAALSQLYRSFIAALSQLYRSFIAALSQL